MAVHLVCEGFRGGLDERVLDAVVIQFHTLGVLTAPAGGSSSLGAVRNFLETRTPSDVAIAVEDRNHRPLADATATWANRAGRAFIWRRHEIENYLLHPRVVLEFFNDIRTLRTQRWASALPATEPDVDALLQHLAGGLLEDHAAEVLRDELVRQINSAGSVGISCSRPAPPPGRHAPGQAEWLSALTQEAARLSQTCSTVNNLPVLQTATITARYNTLVAQYQSPVFLTSGNYLREMGGHELLAALSRHLHSLGARRLNQDNLASELLKVLSRTYRPNTLFQPDDFAELASILAQY